MCLSTCHGVLYLSRCHLAHSTGWTAMSQCLSTYHYAHSAAMSRCLLVQKCHRSYLDITMLFLQQWAMFWCFYTSSCSYGTDKLRFFQKQSLRNLVFETLFFKSAADTLQTLCFANSGFRNFVFQRQQYNGVCSFPTHFMTVPIDLYLFDNTNILCQLNTRKTYKYILNFQLHLS